MPPCGRFICLPPLPHSCSSNPFGSVSSNFFLITSIRSIARVGIGIRRSVVLFQSMRRAKIAARKGSNQAKAPNSLRPTIPWPSPAP
ncbi:hypothetical protein ZHAS_00012550 [Anopheles sinensis]|uniref:Uncharacterized protein n=1 Tax=Anopheles sinensis TaxID=74873 RepID=A0A084W371_ANOSI|nr:hypothetical protein ZHAS_00012550 [Anopheles sinensis]